MSAFGKIVSKARGLVNKPAKKVIEKTTPKVLRNERLKGLALGGTAAAGTAAVASTEKGREKLKELASGAKKAGKKVSDTFTIKKAGLVRSALKGTAAMGAGALAYENKDKLKELASPAVKKGKQIAMSASEKLKRVATK
jgi:hypothetical protein